MEQNDRVKICSGKVSCYCRSNAHHESVCKKKEGSESSRKVTEQQDEENNRLSKVKHTKEDRLPDNVKKDIVVDAGATSHIIKDIKKFISFNGTFLPESHLWMWQTGQGAKQKRMLVITY